MTLKVKSIIVAFFILVSIALSMALFSDYDTLSNSLITNLLVTEKILSAENELYRNFTGEQDFNEAGRVIETIPGLTRDLNIKGLTPEELHHFVEVKMSFIRIGRLIRTMSTEGNHSGPELRQIHDELRKIETVTVEFRKSFGLRTEQEKSLKKNASIFLYLSVGAGIILILIGFYRYFIGPILLLSADIKDVRDGKKDAISVYPVKDEIGRLTDFTNQTLKELSRSNEALSQRLEMQNAIAAVLKASQESEDTNGFLNKVLETILSLKWLGLMSKGAVFLVDETDPNTLVLRAEKNYPESQKKVCARVAVGVCICGQVVKSGVSFYDTLFSAMHQHTYDEIYPHGHYCVPIKHEQDVLGVINLYLEEGHVLSESERVFIDAISLIVTESLIVRRHAEREHLITRAIEESGEGTMIADRNGIIEYVNPALERMTGYAEMELIGTPLAKQIRPGELMPRTIVEILQGNLWSGILKNKRKDGSEYQEHMTVIPVRGAGGDVAQFVAIRRDITKERRLEAQLAQAQKMELLGRLAGGIAHDFNNYMTAILGYSGVVMKNLKEDSRARKGMETMVNATKMAANLTRQLLAFSRKQALRPTVMNLNTIIEEMVRMLKRIIGEDVELEIKAAPDLGNTKADAGQIEQALMNLVVNAKDAMPRGGKLALTTSNAVLDEAFAQTTADLTPGEYVMITVSDTGDGMTDEVKARLFEPFFTTKDQGKGTGLGLAMVHSIVKQNGGHIFVYSEVGKGATFRIYLPRVREEVVREKHENEDMDRLRGVETVLVVEDQDVVREMAVALLSDLGYTVMEAKDGQVALELCKRYRGKIHLLLTDVIMPRLGGRELADQVRELHPESRVLFISGYTDETISHHGILEQGAELVTKPFTESVLLTAVRKVLDR